jgi:anaerobic ribonucleoside-triphosphate reductase
MDDEIYVCMSCGYENHADKFGNFCPACGTDLDELESMCGTEDEPPRIDEEEEEEKEDD